jgi:Arc/MetJ-type ribon-helix-helix transcriptional regulator
MVMTRVKFHAISLPDRLYDDLEEFVNDSRGHYVSIAEVVREALRDYLKKHQSE